jgi:hypothetical protein
LPQYRQKGGKREERRERDGAKTKREKGNRRGKEYDNMII